eukprot:TRINITY_DN10198_c1_g1_i1.p1 TRINITY_DN10198_c1_g1~~TRINITY_DN10198_c1_g1_i1.p1  ORF type:complete len:1658 (+),score=545.93 TRINITY_DN10198_c1_g1_i1:2377-7350(+)
MALPQTSSAPRRRNSIRLRPGEEIRTKISCMGLPDIAAAVPPAHAGDYTQEQWLLKTGLDEATAAYSKYRSANAVPAPPMRRPLSGPSASQASGRVGALASGHANGHASSHSASASPVCKHPGGRLAALDVADSRRKLQHMIESQSAEIEASEKAFSAYRRQMLSAGPKQPARPTTAPSPPRAALGLPPPAAKAWLAERAASAGAARPGEEEPAAATEPLSGTGKESEAAVEGRSAEEEEEEEEYEEDEEDEEEEESSESESEFEDSEEEGVTSTGWAYGAWQEDWFSGAGARSAAAATITLSTRQIGAGRAPCPSLPPRGTCRRPGCGLPAEAARGMYCCERCMAGHGHAEDCTGIGLVGSKLWKWSLAGRGAIVTGDKVTAGAYSVAVLANAAVERGRQEWVCCEMRRCIGVGLADEVAMDQIMDTASWCGLAWWVDLEAGTAHQPWGKPQCISGDVTKARNVQVALDADTGSIRFSIDGSDSGISLCGAVGSEYIFRPVVLLAPGGCCTIKHKLSTRPVRLLTEKQRSMRKASRKLAAGPKDPLASLSVQDVMEVHVEDVADDGDTDSDEWGDGEGSGAAMSAMRWEGPTNVVSSEKPGSQGVSASEGVAFNVDNQGLHPMLVVSVGVVLRDASQAVRMYTRETPHQGSQSKARKLPKAKRLWRAASQSCSAGKGDVRLRLCPPVVVPAGETRALLLHCGGTGFVRVGEKGWPKIDDRCIRVAGASAVERDRSIDAKYRNAFTFVGSIEYATLSHEQVRRFVQPTHTLMPGVSCVESESPLSTQSSKAAWFSALNSGRGRGGLFAKVRRIQAPAQAAVQQDNPVLGQETVPFGLPPPQCSLEAKVLRKPDGKHGLWLLYEPTSTPPQILAYVGRRRGYHRVTVTFAEGAEVEVSEAAPPAEGVELPPLKPAGKKAGRKGKKKEKEKESAKQRRHTPPAATNGTTTPGRRDSAPVPSDSRRSSRPDSARQTPRDEASADKRVKVARGVCPGETVELAFLPSGSPPDMEVVVTVEEVPDEVMVPLMERQRIAVHAELRELIDVAGDDGDELTRLVGDPAALKRLMHPNPVSADAERRCGDPCVIVEAEGGDSGIASCSATAPLSVQFRDGAVLTVPGACIVGRGDSDPAESALRASVAKGLPFVDPTFVPDVTALLGKKARKKKSTVDCSPALLRPLAWMRPRDFCTDTDTHLFVNDICADDIAQGSLADCWLLCALSAAAEASEMVKRLFVGTPEARRQGAYQLRLCKDGWWQKVIVDDYFPCDGPQAQAFAANRAEPNEVWAPLVEKAFAKLRGGYMKLETGDPADALSDITGFPTQRLPWADPSDSFRELQGAHAEGFLVTFSTPKELYCGKAGQKGFGEMNEYKGVGLNPGHGYTLLDAAEVRTAAGPARLVRLRNPWGDSRMWTGAWSVGSSEWTQCPDADRLAKGDEDGTFWMEWQDVRKWFYGSTVCLIRPSWHEFRLATGFGKGGVPAHVVEVTVDGLAGDAPVPCYLGIHQKEVLQDSGRTHWGVRVSLVKCAPDSDASLLGADDESVTKWVVPTGGRSYDGAYAISRDVYLVCELEPGKRNLVVARAAPGCKPFAASLSVHFPQVNGAITVRRPQSKMLKAIAAAKNDIPFPLEVSASPPQLSRVQLNRRCATREHVDLGEDMPPT